ncbi:hypothetical protein HK103_001242 [Boothiomyces macroporosus]|uniref:Cell division cycle protein 123 n=1 Tax=Boothiomyces macroporosus TaxID=261099 RepID=A0AAD5YA09_9FUNG|nr:hypothetical protein HK103_001242 [Boothiomyces macroporosus]
MMSAKDKLECDFSNWFPKFRHLTIKSRIIPLDLEFVEYLKSDSVYIPGMKNIKNEYDVDSDDEESDSEQEVEIRFESLEADINRAIEELGGSVFPKLNWSSPKDAAWIAFNNTLECKAPSDIYLLLKSSDFIVHDLEKAFEEYDHQPEIQYKLVLRQYLHSGLYPSLEFRCFIKDNVLVGISQRDVLNFYPHVVHNKQDIQTAISTFYTSFIHSKFPSSSCNMSLTLDVLDVFCNKELRVLIMDFNPFSQTTDALLFDWEELYSKNEIEMRVVESNEQAACAQPQFAHNRLPKDAFDMSNGKTLDEFISVFDKEIKKQLEEL